MRPHRSTIAGMMTVVVFVALDCFAVRTPELYNGYWLIGCTMQIGYFMMLRSRCRTRRFWAGFEMTGLGTLLAYAAWCRADYRAFNLWPYALLERTYGALGNLPPDAFQWCFEHGLVIDPRKPLRVYEMLIAFEVAYGLPMLLLAGGGGLLAANFGWRRALLSPQPLELESVP